LGIDPPNQIELVVKVKKILPINEKEEKKESALLPDFILFLV
jgi:hypothetical protein